MDELVEGLKQRIEEARAARGTTRAKLASDIGTSASTVTEWYTQGKMPAASHVIRLPEALGVTPEWLLTGAGPRDRVEASVDGAAAAWSEAAQELRALVDRFEARAGKQPAPETEAGAGEATGDAGERPPPRVQSAYDRTRARRQSSGETGTDG